MTFEVLRMRKVEPYEELLRHRHLLLVVLLEVSFIDFLVGIKG